jgi:hypothetical protein
MSERCVADLDEQVQVIGHVTGGVQPCGESFEDVRDQGIGFTIARGEKDVLTMVAAQRDVIERAGHMNLQGGALRCRVEVSWVWPVRTYESDVSQIHADWPHCGQMSERLPIGKRRA